MGRNRIRRHQGSVYIRHFRGSATSSYSCVESPIHPEVKFVLVHSTLTPVSNSSIVLCSAKSTSMGSLSMMSQSSLTGKLLQSGSQDSIEAAFSDDRIDDRLIFKKPSTLHRIIKATLIHLALLTIYTSIIFAFWPESKRSDFHPHSSRSYSPAQGAIKWETRRFENSLETGNPYKGKPREELDKAWNKLLDPSAVRVSKEDLDRINKTSVPIADGSGYMATLDVYHQLHCLRWVRQMLHPDYYGMHNGKEPNLGQHVDHCLDSIRQFVMCKADVVLLTYDWMPNFHRPWPNFEIEHECVNWDSINDWAIEHSFNGFDDNLIKHPNFHPELGSPFSYDVSGNEEP